MPREMYAKGNVEELGDVQRTPMEWGFVKKAYNGAKKFVKKAVKKHILGSFGKKVLPFTC